MLCLVGFPLRILVELSLLMFACGSCPLYAYYDGDDLDMESIFSVVCHYGLFEWFVYVVYVGDGVHSVVVCGVLTLCEL